MKIVVDKMPKTPEECLFHKTSIDIDVWGDSHKYSRCSYSKTECNLEKSCGCPYLTILIGSDR